MYPADLIRLYYGAVSYIRTETPGLIVGFKYGFKSFKFLLNISNIFINYLETWSQVSGDWFCLFVVVNCFVLMIK